MTLKEKDFVQIEYTGKLKETGDVFDTTDEKTAKDSGLYDTRYKYGPVIICLGRGQILAGLEKELVGKSVDKSYTFDLKPEDAFGKKSAKLLKLIPSKAFKKDKIQPMNGMQVNVDGNVGIVRSASPGRVIVDFNHPLSGKDLEYSVKVIKKIEDPLEQATSILKNEFYITDQKVTLKDGTLTISIDLPDDLSAQMLERIAESVPSVKKVVFEKPKSEEDEKTKTENKKNEKKE